MRCCCTRACLWQPRHDGPCADAAVHLLSHISPVPWMSEVIQSAPGTVWDLHHACIIKFMFQPGVNTTPLLSALQELARLVMHDDQALLRYQVGCAHANQPEPCSLCISHDTWPSRTHITHNHTLGPFRHTLTRTEYRTATTRWIQYIRTHVRMCATCRCPSTPTAPRWPACWAP